MHELFYDLISEFGQNCGIPELTPNADGSVQLLFDHSLAVTLFPTATDDQLIFFCAVKRDDPQVTERLMLRLLDASLFGHSTNGSSFAIEESTGQVILQRMERSPGLTYHEFEQILQSFIDAAEFWSKEIHKSENDIDGRPRFEEQQVHCTASISV